MRGSDRATRRLLVAHPSPDLYGSDRQLAETVSAAVEGGWHVVVVLPSRGPLVGLLESRGARVVVVPFPVLRKDLLRPLALAAMPVRFAWSTLSLAGRLRRWRPSVLLVNTVTIPQWLAAGRLAGLPTLCHVHEAEEAQPRLVRRLLAAPLLLARRVLANSGAARDAVVSVAPPLRRSVVVVHNGVPGPDDEPAAPRRRSPGERAQLALVGRLSPRKGTDTAVEALALLRDEGRDVDLVLCGSVFPGYEWYEQELVELARTRDLTERVELAGYVHPTWPVLADADVVLVPSRTEPFGNAAVEGMLARRPVVACGVQGLREVLRDGVTGILVEPDDPAALARAIGRLLDEPDVAVRLAEAGLADARDRFSVARYRRDVLRILDDVLPAR